jgi:hypothetical protein
MNVGTFIGQTRPPGLACEFGDTRQTPYNPGVIARGKLKIVKSKKRPPGVRLGVTPLGGPAA